MSDEKKVVKGGFRATLALIISIIALIVAIVAFNRTGGQADLNVQIRDLQAKMEKMKKETSERVNKVRDETAKALEKIGKAVKKEDSKQ
jgi:predicted Holliday junction resolvase-like endonuclease